MKKPNLDEVKLTGEQRDALVKRLEDDQLSAEDRQLLAKVIPLFFWLTLTLRETKLSMKRLKVALFGSGQRKTPKNPPDDAPSSGVGPDASPSKEFPSAPAGADKLTICLQSFLRIPWLYTAAAFQDANEPALSD